MIPTAISPQILEQVINAIISVVAASVLFKVGLDTAKVYGKDGYAQAFGAAGGTIGTGSGAFAAPVICAGIVFTLPSDGKTADCHAIGAVVWIPTVRFRESSSLPLFRLS